MNNTNSKIRTGTMTFAALAGAAALIVTSPAWSSPEVVGTWKMVSNVSTRADGTKVDTFGNPPNGQAIFTADGRFSIVNVRPDLPKFASGRRVDGTADENKAVVQGSIALFGTYTVTADKAIVMKVEGSTYPNWIGQEQKRPYRLAGDDLIWSVPQGSVGGTAEVAWRRMK